LAAGTAQVHVEREGDLRHGRDEGSGFFEMAFFIFKVFSFFFPTSCFFLALPSSSPSRTYGSDPSACSLSLFLSLSLTLLLSFNDNGQSYTATSAWSFRWYRSMSCGAGGPCVARVAGYLICDKYHIASPFLVVPNWRPGSPVWSVWCLEKTRPFVTAIDETLGWRYPPVALQLPNYLTLSSGSHIRSGHPFESHRQL